MRVKPEARQDNSQETGTIRRVTRLRLWQWPGSGHTALGQSLPQELRGGDTVRWQR